MKLKVQLTLFALIAFGGINNSQASASITLTFTPQGGPIGVSGAINGTNLIFLESIIVELADGTVANATNSIAVADVLSVTARIDGADYLYDAAPTVFSDNDPDGLSDVASFAYFRRRFNGQNIQIANGANALTLDGTTVVGTNFSLVGNSLTTFNGGADLITTVDSFFTSTTTFDVSAAQSTSLSAVPEPTSLLVWSLLGSLGFTATHRRRRRVT